jgi:electron transfer flavoprotein alpha subunit
MEVAPWVAARLSVPLLPNCVGLDVEGDDLVAERLVHGQAWQARLHVRWRGTVVASLARSGGAPAPVDGAGAAALERLEIDPAALGIRTRVTGATRPAAGEVDIARAEVVVGVGRGIGDSSNLPLVEDLAEALGGVVACSRPLVDLEWMDYGRQVGASDKAIRPKVYLACGISGAAQHLAGITDAETVVAINRDPNAPIFRVAHYGAVADLLQVVPELTAEARRRRAARSAD